MPAIILLGYTLGGTPISVVQVRVSKVLEAAALLGCYDINFSHLKVLICNENMYNNVRQASILLLLLLLKC